MTKEELLLNNNESHILNIMGIVRVLSEEATKYALSKLDEDGYNYQIIDSAIAGVRDAKGNPVTVVAKSCRIIRDFDDKANPLGLGLYRQWVNQVENKDTDLLVIYVGCGCGIFDFNTFTYEFFTMFDVVRG